MILIQLHGELFAPLFYSRNFMQDKVIQIEEHLIHLEKQFDELNQVIYKQSLKIDELEKSVSSLNDKLDQNQSVESNNQLERPPHY